MIITEAKWNESILVLYQIPSCHPPLRQELLRALVAIFSCTYTSAHPLLVNHQQGAIHFARDYTVESAR